MALLLQCYLQYSIELLSLRWDNSDLSVNMTGDSGSLFNNHIELNHPQRKAALLWQTVVEIKGEMVLTYQQRVTWINEDLLDFKKVNRTGCSVAV